MSVKTSQALMKVPAMLLLSVYGLVFLAAVVVSADILVFDKALLAVMPRSPHELFWFNALFTLPHIVASQLMFLDREYITHHRKSLYRGAMIGVMFIFGTYFIFGPMVFNILFLVYTIYHVLKQQLGINKLLLQRKPDLPWYIAEYSMIFGATLMYIAMMEPYAFGYSFEKIFAPYVYTIVAVAVFVFLFVARLSKTRVGKYYTWANLGLLVFSTLFYEAGYYCLIIFTARVIHDVTAFTIYSVHDHNRHAEKPRQYLYQRLKGMKVPVVVLCPLVALFLAFPLTYFQAQSVHSTAALFVISFLGIMHYYTESVVWKNNSPNRKFVPFNIA